MEITPPEPVRVWSPSSLARSPRIGVTLKVAAAAPESLTRPAAEKVPAAEFGPVICI
jgi:hypothetical protein